VTGDQKNVISFPQKLMRAPVSGGPVEQVAEVYEKVLPCGVAREGERVFVVVKDGIAVTGPDHRLRHVVKGREKACHLRSEGERLFWTEDETAPSLMSSDLDGGHLRVVWQSSHREKGEVVVSRVDDGPKSYLFVSCPREPFEDGCSSVVAVPRAKGRAQVLWTGSEPIADGGLDGADLVWASAEVAYRLPRTGKKPSTIKMQLERAPLVWRGWVTPFVGDATDASPLTASKLKPPGPARTVFPQVLGALYVDRDWLYACAATRTGRCDLARISPAYLEHLPSAR
jgi:hypothetical protein